MLWPLVIDALVTTDHYVVILLAYPHCLWLSWMRLHLPEQHSPLLLQCAPFLSQQRPFLQRRPGLQGQLSLQGLFALPV